MQKILNVSSHYANEKRHFDALVSLVSFAPSETTHAANASDWNLIQFLTKAAAEIIIPSLQGAALVADFYDIMTSVNTLLQVVLFPLKL